MFKIDHNDPKYIVSDEEKTSCLQSAIYNIVCNWPFVGSILQCMNMFYSYQIERAAIAFNPECRRWDLVLNPYFFCKLLTAKQRVAILRHEILHLENQHPFRIPFLRLSPQKQQLMNCAADMAINQFIPHLPAGCSSCPPPEQLMKGEECSNPDCPGGCIDVEHYYELDKSNNRIPWPKLQSTEVYYDKYLAKFAHMLRDIDNKYIEVQHLAEESLDVTVFGSRSTKLVTATADGPLVLNEKPAVKGDLVLLTAQDKPQDNGIYTVDHPGCDQSRFVLRRYTSHNGVPGNPVLQGDVAYTTVEKKGKKFTSRAFQQQTKGHPKTGIQVDKEPQVWQEVDPNQAQASKDGSGKGLPQTIDQHRWDANAEESEMLDATEDLVKRAMIKQNFGHDQVPGGFKQLLEDIAARKAELNYKAIILSAIKRHASGHDREGTWTRPSRRYKELAPGTREGRLPSLSIYLDSSGSISVEELREFLSIVDEFLKVGARKCKLNLFHTTNYYSAPYKRGEHFDAEKVESGGTDLTDSFKNIIESNPDMAIIVTDGYYSKVQYEEMLKPNQQLTNVLFIISREGTADHPMKELPTVKIPNSTKLKGDKDLESK